MIFHGIRIAKKPYIFVIFQRRSGPPVIPSGSAHGSLFCGVVLGALSSLAIILLRKRELVCFTLIVLWLSVFCVSSSWCCGLVCSLSMWHFLIILTFFYIVIVFSFWKMTSDLLILKFCK